MRTNLRRDLTEAIKVRDRVAIAALRSALAAIENAEAPEVDDRRPVVPTAGVGSTEVERRHLTEADVHTIVAAEVTQRSTAAAEYERLGRADQAERLRAEADVLRRHLTA
ncbi:hypothetical protein ALI22I_06900 [Saccharothrix sp. ALI-22-I]|nr:GatB/YqeY domain-containing protein [Saccharothrix sp. ALI-22-I]ONI91863.1 hypothetical protein ALI22I_06900 [Saccharothrix sp. ALI-22-I]